MDRLLLVILCGGITGAIVGVLVDGSAAVGILGFLVGVILTALGLYTFGAGASGPD